MRFLNLSLRRTFNGIGLYLHYPKRGASDGEGSDRQKTLSEFHLAKDKPVKLNVGGAKGHPAVEGWKVVDTRSSADIVLDMARAPLPFEDNSVDVIFCSHTLEHIIPQRIELANSHNANVFIIIPPTLLGDEPGKKELLEYMESIQAERNFVYRDFGSTVTDLRLFRDHTHLNTEGIIYFTKRYLKPLLEAQQ